MKAWYPTEPTENLLAKQKFKKKMHAPQKQCFRSIDITYFSIYIPTSS